MSGDERLFAVVPLGGAQVLLEATQVGEIAPLERALASEWPRLDLASVLGASPPEGPHALLVGEPPRCVWLLVEPGTRFQRLPRSSLAPMPAWLASALVRAVASLAPGFGFELDVSALLERSRDGAPRA